ncbi:MAG TPA: ATP-binding cassette domain-containing protein [Planctomycetota bacterium]|nr:ATP-binding cassette domain-containing protein [Planctomycetota bacterium]
MIEANQLRKEYPGKVALQGVNFTVDKGEIVGFLGPNGAGKTTTMRILTGFLPPTSGTARIAGFDVTRDSIQARRRIGYLPEANPLYTDMRVREYLSYRARLKGVDPRVRKERVQSSVLRCGLEDQAGRIIAQLSKGMRQRVGLADAIVHDPDVLILDEPTIGLDPNQIRQVRELVRELGRDKTVILSTHILSEVEVMCRRVLIIHEGRIVAQGTTQEIGRHLKLTGRIRFEIAGGEGKPVKEALETISKVVRVVWNARTDGGHTFLVESEEGSDIRAELHKLAVQKGWPVRELALESLTLEDAFARLTEKAA